MIVSRFDKSFIGTNYRDLGAANTDTTMHMIREGGSNYFIIPAPDGRDNTAFYHHPVQIGDMSRAIRETSCARYIEARAESSTQETSAPGTRENTWPGALQPDG